MILFAWIERTLDHGVLPIRRTLVINDAELNLRGLWMSCPNGAFLADKGIQKEVRDRIVRQDAG